MWKGVRWLSRRSGYRSLEILKARFEIRGRLLRRCVKSCEKEEKSHLQSLIGSGKGGGGGIPFEPASGGGL